MRRLALLAQGTGFRPNVWWLAHANQLSGSVRNTHDGVCIEVQGESTERYIDGLCCKEPE